MTVIQLLLTFPVVSITMENKTSKERGILKLEPRSKTESRYELTMQGTFELTPSSPQPSIDRLSVTWADTEEDMASSVNLYHIPPETTTSNEVKFSPGAECSEDEDYSASLSAVLRQRRASVRRSRKGRTRRSSSPFLPDEAKSRRRSSVFTTSSGDTAISMEDQPAVVTQEQIMENIYLHKEVLLLVKQQPYDVRRKLKIVHQAKSYIKRHEGQLQERLAQSKSTKDIYARFNILLSTKLQQLKREAANMSNFMIPWESRIKEIESHFGSVVASYFTFLRWLFWVNLVIGFILSVFVIVPEYLTANPEQDGERKIILEDERHNATKLLTLWEFEGVLKYSPIFYGYYSNIDRHKYRMPLAYFLTGLAVYIYSFVATLRKMAENSRMSKLSEKEDECIFSWKLFTGWDFMIGNAETAHNRIASVILGFKEALLEEAEKKKDLRNWRIISLRALVNVCVILLLAVSAFAVVTVVSRSDDKHEVRSWWRENETTIVVTVISITFPVFFELLGFLEHYHPRKQLRLQLARIMVLNLLNLYSLIFALFSKIGGMSIELDSLQPSINASLNTDNIFLNRTIDSVGNFHTNQNQTNCSEVRVSCMPCEFLIDMPISSVLTAVGAVKLLSSQLVKIKKMPMEINMISSTERYSSSNLAYRPQMLADTLIDISTEYKETVETTTQNSYDSSVHNEMIRLRKLSNSTEFNDTSSEISDEDNDYTFEDISNSITSTLVTELSSDIKSGTLETKSTSTFSTDSESTTSSGDISSDNGIYTNKMTIPDMSWKETTESTFTTTESNFQSTLENRDTTRATTEYTESSTSTDYITTQNVLEDTSTEISRKDLMCPDMVLKCKTVCLNVNMTQVLVISNCKVVESYCLVTKCYSYNMHNHNTTTNSTNNTVKDIAYLDDHNRKMYNLTKETKKKLLKLCWETMFGQELVKLTMMDLVFVLFGTLIMDFFRAIFVRYMNRCWCWDLEKKFPEYGDFKIAENILHLINNQGMVWMGMFFSPGLVVLNVFKLVIMMYLRSWAVMTCNVPHEVVFRVSKSNNFYLALLLTMLFLCVLPVGYSIVWVKPSWHCGPFSEYDKIYHILTSNIYKILPESLNFALKCMASPATVIPLLVLLILIIYYLTSLTNSLREANNDLKFQLRRERTEERRKMFQLADTRSKGGSAAIDNTPFSRWRKALPSLPFKSIDSDDRKDVPGEDGLEHTKPVKKRGGIFAKIVDMALDRKTVGEEPDNNISPSTNADDETDTDFHETLPAEILKVKDIKVINDQHKVKPFQSVDFRAVFDEKHKPQLKKVIDKFKITQVIEKVKKRAEIKTDIGEQDAQIKKNIQKRDSHENDKIDDKKMLTRRQTSESSTQSKHSDSIGSVIPVIMISTTESDDEILESKKGKVKEINIKNEAKSVKKSSSELKALRRQSSVESISEKKDIKGSKEEQGHKFQYSL